MQALLYMAFFASVYLAGGDSPEPAATSWR